MGRQKLKKFEDNDKAGNIVQAGKPIYETIKGNWRAFFGNDKPLVVELACGRGEYSVGLAGVFPEKNFVGVDIKGARLWTGSQAAYAQGLDNVAFLRAYIQNLTDFFAPQEIDELWITFPDPRPRNSDERRRLTHPRFLAMYRQLLKPEGWLHLKTDSDSLFEYTLETLAEHPIKDFVHTSDLYSSSMAQDHHGIKTYYEHLFSAQGFSIKYLRFRFA
ncbi:tRNA (guanosine(46)-N7)-methyltransferase TrmB [Eisenibacter elegans]|jgi:tRNA (guanine-N7-)-methyltransferase|uniref:tRNA (guanosine(46)-N7)-methyltransferase TrmB n=1 Tax=Eisenibacter elegans TaxID=997 RepID=UPI000407A219|nr:tRNA (guanosine(46)-N7)-methyltransferase TrmB [Eisenibacter elegans]